MTARLAITLYGAGIVAVLAVAAFFRTRRVRIRRADIALLALLWPLLLAAALFGYEVVETREIDS